MNSADPDDLGETVTALRTKYDEVAKLMRDLELEMARLSPDDRRERMPEFDARVIALMQDSDDIVRSAGAFLRLSAYPKGNA